MNIRSTILLVVVIVPAFARAAEPTPTTFNVDGVDRQALIFAPISAILGTRIAERTVAAPLLFAFHGHGGNMHNAARKFDFQSLWPEAIVVYMQGLPTPSKIDKEGKDPGWQHYSGQLGDRDLKFFDKVLVFVRNNYHVDDRRIYVTGFSNGGAFTYFLWAHRPAVFAAVAPMAGLPWPTEPPTIPKPAFIVAGENDNLVNIKDQETMIARIRDLDLATASQPQPAANGTTLYPSDKGAPVVTLIHPGGHQLPPTATRLIVDFFRQHPPAK